MKKVLLALGGNALLRSGEKGSAEEQLKHLEEASHHFLEIINAGYHIAITHGNGPQVGAILLKNEMAAQSIPAMPLDICGAESQGFIGYMIQRQFYNVIQKYGSSITKNIPIVTVLTQVVVDKEDVAFKNPSKPIGLFYTKEQSENLKKEKKWTMVEQQGKGFRRVVPSPKPKDVVEGTVIKKLFDEKKIVIACGGGGIPVIKEKDGSIIGVEAVIDKDLTAALLGDIIKADILLILTDVEKVAINFGKPNQQNLDKLTLKEAKEYIAKGEFAKGSMGPKVEAAVLFVEGGGKKAIITSLEKSKDALNGKTGTVIS